MKRDHSAGVVVFCEGKYLLLKYEAGHWDFPKGHLEQGEDDKTAALRELKEEAGISAQIIDGFSHTINYKLELDGELVSKDVVFFFAICGKSLVKLSHEHTDFIWLEFEDALKKVTYKSAKEVLAAADEWRRKNGVEWKAR
ncbi:NUDIX domain-containing protein [Candidatus Woesearchaeota archaeon]|nr:NUDIX domain-containing protein [Candidatus Woesearchaeota archaeon]